eukprot:CAMPEP_0116888646 /NCGR_PEP_ID=MMETSP0463-20121206/23788_1 /TAXON_ID=181622 /ORGANISM="Strombidinopsis sp, Strain SopsisLIS2011" /LENGTH=35 /DNA_ID= /DNA_START= /DNA_END= /DNA_ORIENTATION=
MTYDEANHTQNGGSNSQEIEQDPADAYNDDTYTQA